MTVICTLTAVARSSLYRTSSLSTNWHECLAGSIAPETWNIMLGLRVVALTGRFDHTIAVTFDYEHIADRFSTGFPSTRLISASTSVVKLAPMLQTAKSGFAVTSMPTASGPMGG